MNAKIPIRPLSCQRGFSLMEVMVAASVMAVLAVGMMSLQQSGFVAQKSMLALDDTRAITNTIAQMMQDSTACNNTFGGKTASATAGSAITAIKDAAGATKFATGTTSANLYGNRGAYLESIAIGNTAPALDTTPVDGNEDHTKQSFFAGPNPVVTTAAGIATVTVRYLQTGRLVTTGTNTKTDIMGPQYIYRYFNLNVTVDTSYVVLASPKCSSVSGMTVVSSLGTGSQNYVAKWLDNAGTLGNSLMYDSGTGVGIGTTAPGQLLDIQGNTGGNVVIQAKNNGAGRAILQADSGAASDAAVKFYNQGAAIGGISAFPGNSLVFYGVGNTEQMRITSAGYAGIGTSTPQSILQLGTGLNFYDNWPVVAFNTYISGPSWVHATASSSSLIYEDYGNQGLRFITSPSGAAGATITQADALFLGPTGNVGIGTVTPGAGVGMTGGLTINGTGSTQLTVEKSATPGFALNVNGSSTGDYQLFDRALGAWKSSLIGYNSSVGLGAFPPTKKLDVVGTASFGGNNSIDSYVILAADATTNNPMIEGRNRANTAKKALLINPYGGAIGLGTNAPAANAIATIKSTNHGLLSYVNSTAWIAVLGQDLTGGCYGYLASGGYSAGGNCGTAFASDARLKDAISPITDGLKTVLALKPVSFFWKNEGKNRPLLGEAGKKARNLGFLAQDVQKVLPDLVSEDGGLSERAEKIPGIDTPKKGWLSLDYVGLIAPLVAAVQELSGALDRLKAELSAIKSSLAQTRTRMQSSFAQLKAELRLEHDTVAARLAARKTERVGGGGRDLASVRGDFSALKARSEKLERENKALRRQNEQIKAYLCGKDPASSLCATP